MLRLLEQHELTVSELCTVLQLPQSTTSRHLRTLLDDDWVTARRDGTSRYYAMSVDELPADARRLWQLIREQVAESAGAAHDDARVEQVLAGRRSKSKEFFSSVADEWDRLRADMFGDRVHLHALVGLVADDWVIGDLGCGTGAMAQTLAPFVKRVVAVDSSHEMLRAARRRLEAVTNVDIRQGDVEALPIADGELDAAVVMLVLHHLAEPARALAEAARVVKPGGRLLVVDMRPHDRTDYQHQMGHVWLGFSETQMRRLLASAGFEAVRLAPLPVDSNASGPTLFAATARRDRTAPGNGLKNQKTAERPRRHEGR
jgi:ArsR family transcriptional regulator